ncbi:MAG: hypothetical protein CMG64_06455, partial [Candidatus Marinimicrobia bacterium]|nr:hypothetical protein [Candidatus Neomarinimicrobiota bacterium]
DDSDNDGSCDSDDLCTGNDTSGDTDSDGVCDDTDSCPLDANDDSDGDGSCDSDDICDGHDDSLDADGDSVADGCDVCHNGNDTVDTDSDGMPDDCDVDIALNVGNNLVSFYALPDAGLDVGEFFSGTTVYQVIGEGVSSVINNDGDWVGSLGDITADAGYWVRTEEASDLEVQGGVVGSVTYTLAEGSNLLSYPHATTQSLSDAIPAEAADATFAVVGQGLAALNIGSWVGSLADNATGGLRGGSGYWFTTTLEGFDTVDFEYNAPQAGEVRSEISNLSMPTTPEGFEYTQSTLQGFYFVEEATFDGVEISDGDWIVAYNENVVVGSWPWRGAYTTVPAMGYDGSEETIGYMENGQLPTFKLFKAEDGSLNDMTIVDNVDTWSNNGVTVVTLSGSTPVPTEITLNGSYPNPFNPSTNISFNIPAEMHVSLVIYDINGRMVTELVNGMRSADTYNVVWNANQNASGVYFVKLAAGNTVHTQKIMLIK